MIEMIIVAAIALVLFGLQHMMAAENTGLTVDSTAVYQGGGDPAYIYLVAYEAITPGDNVAPAGTQQCYQSDIGASPVYMGTADKNDNAVLDNNNPMTHDFAEGEVVPVITGHCHVRKIADTNGSTAGKVQRIGAADGAEVENNASTMKYSVGRALTTATSGNALIMNQWG